MVAVKTYANARRNSLRFSRETLFDAEMNRLKLGRPTAFTYLEWGIR